MGDEASFFEALPVVLTVSRLPQPVQDTPGAATVIDAELIAATGYRDLARLLRLVPGMQVGQERGNDQWVTYHGLGSDYPNQMQVLVDGRSIYSPYFFGGADWGALPVALADIERIEVVRGSDSAAYGSNAFLGVVNIITRHTAAESGSSVQVNAGNRGIADVTARAVMQHGPLGLRLTAQRQRDDGMPDMHDGRDIRVLNLRGDLRLGERDELTLLAGLSEGERDMGYSGVLFDSSATRTARHLDRSLHLRWRHTPAPDEEWSLAYYHNRERTRDDWFVDSSRNIETIEGALPPAVRDYLLDAKRIPVDNDRDSRRDNVELQHRFRAGAATQLLWGAEWRRDWLDAPYLFYGKGAQSQHEWRLFGNLEWRLAPRWLVNAGAMAERIDADRTRLAPRLFLNWQPQATQTVRIGWSRAWRQPSLFEREADVRIVHEGQVLNYRHLPNPDIQPQRIDAFEVGYLGVLPVAAGTLDLRLFHERIRDLVQRRPVDVTGLPLASPPVVQQVLGSTRWENFDGTVRLNGLEYRLNLHPWRDGELIFNHSLIRVSSNDRSVRDSVAPYTAGLTLLQRLGLWQGSLSVLRMGPIDAGSGYVREFRYRVPAYTTVDFSVARSTRLGGVPVELRLSGINLFGRHQELAHRPLQFLHGTQRPANEIGRQVHLSVRASF
ncbi:TonB-dependent receptor plug domain-containing protein [Pseudothauera rhizosphaerae]|uniref:TonB-dependent receptor plug domain-containing protein n=1 Tax=Pseudothauera rhizosphaerae TaxID=2565932 RepID=UPI001E2ECE52|nr:TonB-dependent receptor [Pseudothauera rhizosphaerae]